MKLPNTPLGLVKHVSDEMRVEDILFTLFIFLIPATVASYVFIRISKVRRVYFPTLLVIGCMF